MSLWLGQTLPAAFGSLWLEIEHVEGPIDFNLAKHTPAGFTESYIDPQGAEGQTITIKACFPSATFEAHKIFIEELKLCVVPNMPGVFTHPLYGPLTVYPRKINPVVDAATREAVVEVTFEKHFVKPDVPLAAAPVILVPTDGQSVLLSAAGYLSAMAFLAAWNSAWIAAAMLLLRAGAVIDIVSRAPGALGEQLSTWSFSIANQFAAEQDPRDADPAQPEPSPDAFARAVGASADYVIHSFLQTANISESAVDAIAAGGDYSGLGGLSGLSGQTTSSTPRFHAALTACAIFHSQCANVAASRLGRILARQAQSNVIDPSAAEAAIVLARRGLSRAARLAEAAFGVAAAPIVRDCSFQGAQLLKLMERFPVLKRTSRVVTVMTSKPLVLLAMDWGIPDRADEIKKLNPRIVADFNRLPRGTELRIPA
jgi:hypothetical protein